MPIVLTSASAFRCSREASRVVTEIARGITNIGTATMLIMVRRSRTISSISLLKIA